MEIIGAERGHVSVNNHFDPVDPFAGRASSQFTLHTPDSIYRSYNVFEPGVPFVSAVRALIIPRTFLPAPFSLLSFSFLFFFSSSSPQSGHSSGIRILERVRVCARCIVSSRGPPAIRLLSRVSIIKANACRNRTVTGVKRGCVRIYAVATTTPCSTPTGKIPDNRCWTRGRSK